VKTAFDSRRLPGSILAKSRKNRRPANSTTLLMCGKLRQLFTNQIFFTDKW